MRCAERLGKGSFAILGRLTRVKILMGVKSRLDAAVAQATRSSNRGQKVRSSLKLVFLDCQDRNLNDFQVSQGERPLRVKLRSECMDVAPPKLPSFA